MANAQASVHHPYITRAIRAREGSGANIPCKNNQHKAPTRKHCACVDRCVLNAQAPQCNFGIVGLRTPCDAMRSSALFQIHSGPSARRLSPSEPQNGGRQINLPPHANEHFKQPPEVRHRRHHGRNPRRRLHLYSRPVPPTTDHRPPTTDHRQQADETTTRRDATPKERRKQPTKLKQSNGTNERTNALTNENQIATTTQRHNDNETAAPPSDVHEPVRTTAASSLSRCCRSHVLTN